MNSYIVQRSDTLEYLASNVLSFWWLSNQNLAQTYKSAAAAKIAIAAVINSHHLTNQVMRNKIKFNIIEVCPRQKDTTKES